MRTIQIADETLCGGAELTFKEKLEIAGALDALNVHSIELPAPVLKQDALLYKALSATVRRSALSVRVALSEEGVDEAFSSVQEAPQKRLCVCVPLSPAQLEYQCHKKPKAVPETVGALVARARGKGVSVVFMARDATRAEDSLLCGALEAAVAAGADPVILCDDAGQMLPDEFAAFVRGLYEKVPALQSVTVGVSCADDMRLALPCALEALKAGAAEAVTCVGAGAHPSPEELCVVLEKRGATLDMALALDLGRVNLLSRRIEGLLASPRSATSPFDNGVRPAAEGETLTRESGIQQVFKAISALGYDLSDEDRQKVFEAFRVIAEKKAVAPAELDAIVASVAMQVPAAYKLESYVINNGNIITATAHIKLTRDGRALEGISVGDGPIDAAFLAIEKIVGHHFELDDFKIKSVTEGREAMGDALVRLRAGGKLYAGRGTSTDIIGAAIRAYLSALNKIVFDEVNAQ
jgi:2-isopropylmalate synthase